MDIEYGLAIDWFACFIQCALTYTLWLSDEWYQIRSANFRLNSLNFSLASYTFTTDIDAVWLDVRSILYLVFVFFSLLVFLSLSQYITVASSIANAKLAYASNSSSRITFTLCCFWCDMCCLVIWFARVWWFLFYVSLFLSFCVCCCCCFFFVQSLWIFNAADSHR